MKPYNSLSDHLKEKLGAKTVKLSVNAGFSCPNRDGKISRGGCIFCSGSGSGDFAPPADMPIDKQLELSRQRISAKWPDAKYIAYFQAFTNTYAPVDVLEKKYNEALSCPWISGIAIATRPDCMGDGVADLLKDISEKTYLWVEFGLQTSREDTAELINRGYKNEVYLDAMEKMKKKRDRDSHSYNSRSSRRDKGRYEKLRHIRRRSSYGRNKITAFTRHKRHKAA